MIRRLEAFIRPYRPRSVGRRTVCIAVLAAGAGWMSGCERPTPTGEDAASRESEANEHPAARSEESAAARFVSGPVNDPSAAARQQLRHVVDRYRAAKSYRDRAVVRMAYRAADGVQHDSAPLAVHYVAPDQLVVEAYSTRLEWRGGRFRAFIDAPEVNRLDRQVLQRTFKSKKVEVRKLYRDPVLAHFAAAGPGGPAPQVELLFGENPLAGFFADGMRMDLGEESTIDGRTCQELRIEADGARYALWIDRRENLIRRIELPSMQLPQERAGELSENDRQPDAANVTLSIDFVDAAFDQLTEPTAERMPQADVVSVDAFTLPPPPLVSPLMGRQPQPFRLSCHIGGPGGEAFDVTERGSDRERVILLWVANHTGSGLAIEQLAAFIDQLSPEVREKSRFAVVQAEPLDQSVQADLARHRWLARVPDHDAVGRDRFSIEQAPAVCVMDSRGLVHWLQSPVGPEMTATLSGLLRDLEAGVDVGSALRQKYEGDVAAYRQLLNTRSVE